MSVRCKECGAIVGHGVELGHRTSCPKLNKICYACCTDNHLNQGFKYADKVEGLL